MACTRPDRVGSEKWVAKSSSALLITADRHTGDNHENLEEGCDVWSLRRR
jgi:hypothetical protein